MKVKITSINGEKLQKYLQKLSKVCKVEVVNSDNYTIYIIEINNISDLDVVMSIIWANISFENNHLHFPLNVIIYDDCME